MSLFNRQPKETLLLAEERRIAGRHVSLRPTKLCISMLALSVAIWVGAVNYQVNVAYAICFWVLAFIGIAALMTRRQLLGLHLNARYEGEVFAGDTAEVEISTEHSGKRARVFWWRSESREEVDEDSEADHSACNGAAIFPARCCCAWQPPPRLGCFMPNAAPSGKPTRWCIPRPWRTAILARSPSPTPSKRRNAQGCTATTSPF